MRSVSLRSGSPCCSRRCRRRHLRIGLSAVLRRRARSESWLNDLKQTSGDSKLVLGAAAGWHPRSIGVEFEVSVLPGFFDGPADPIIVGNVTTVMGNVTWQLPKPHASSGWRAYVAAGAGIVRIGLEDALDAFSTRKSLAAANAGGGVLVRSRPRLDINVDVGQFQVAVWRCGPSRIHRAVRLIHTPYGWRGITVLNWRLPIAVILTFRQFRCLSHRTVTHRSQASPKR